MAKCLVTGGAGFIGGHIVERLLKDGHEVRVLDNFSTGRRSNIRGFEADIELIEGDIRDRSALRGALHSVEFVFHQAATPSVPRSIEDPAGTNESNITGTLNVLLESRDARVARVMFASSSSIYGDAEATQKVETLPMAPLSPYALQKAAGETYMRLFHKLYGLETVSLRYFNVFGPRQDPDSEYSAVIPRFIKKILRNEALTIFGDGEQSRDFTYVDNVVAANIGAMKTPKGACGRVYNVACGESFSLNRMADEFARISGRDVRREYLPPRAGDVKHSLADISEARKYLGYQPDVSFRQGLERTYEYFRSILK